MSDSPLRKGERAANHYVMVEKVAERKTSIILPDGMKDRYEVYCRLLNISAGVDVDKLGCAVGDIVAGPRILWVPGLPKNVGLMSAGDIFYRADELPDGVTPLNEAATVDDFINPGLARMLTELKPVDPEVHPLPDIILTHPELNSD